MRRAITDFVWMAAVVVALLLVFYHVLEGMLER